MEDDRFVSDGVTNLDCRRNLDTIVR